ncbi:translation initiation factor 2 [Streptomyces sp. NBC_01808]|uniref:translation initiation factor 2 n=1 Tax=Streptomyces sp. NBC_01808 TaxID=2975947 RepID=UPI002DDA80D6|nr:translation initiation factor 2 [Streptomyces sp. NBC_01808]WSA42389.1 translation initiation factor 2 [Streptomyces sp. NBC_01808]
MLLAARSAVALYRLLDALPALAGDDRVTRLFTLVPGSDFGVDVLAAVEDAGVRTVPWHEACTRSYDLILTASPKGDLDLLHGRRVLLPHGAGYNKAIPYEGSGAASGLDPAYLLRDGGRAAPVALHAVSHPDQLARLAASAPQAARRAKVIGDLTLERILASGSLRDRYRAALGTGPRRLVALVSTWGPESLLRRDPGLPARLAGLLPYDEYQLALIVHPNEHSLLRSYELAERLAPALDAGLVLAHPHQEWASVLVAADALVTDHGSAALYYCAAADRPVVNAYRGGVELIPGSPMDVLLSRVPRLGRAGDLADALGAYRPGTGRDAARAAFAHRGSALGRLRTELYALLGLTPPAVGNPLRLLPPPRPADRTPAAFDVAAEVTGSRVRVIRRPAGLGAPGDHLAVEHGAASERLARSAGVLYRRPLPAPAAEAGWSWTADGWARHALAAYPGCRTAVAVLPSGGCLVRTRDTGFVARAAPAAEDGATVRPDPAAVASAVHAWLRTRGRQQADPVPLTCVVGGRAFRVELRPATGDDEAQPV